MKLYHPTEERINVITHALGLFGSVIAFGVLFQKGLDSTSNIQLVSYCIYTITMSVLFLASTLYHSSKNLKKRKRLKIFDHAAIYLMIAGTYTPFCLVVLKGTIGWSLFIFVWVLAIIGVILKIFFTGRFGKISTLTYVAMGWVILLVYKPLKENLAEGGLFWLIAGGAAFTLGAILYLLPQLKFNHAIFHTFGLIGSACHFICVYYYV